MDYSYCKINKSLMYMNIQFKQPSDTDLLRSIPHFDLSVQSYQRKCLDWAKTCCCFNAFLGVWFFFVIGYDLLFRNAR